MARGPQRRGAQCSCIGCIGLRPVLLTGEFVERLLPPDTINIVKAYQEPVAARGEIGPEGCEISSLVEYMGLSPWLFL